MDPTFVVHIILAKNEINRLMLSMKNSIITTNIPVGVVNRKIVGHLIWKRTNESLTSLEQSDNLAKKRNKFRSWCHPRKVRENTNEVSQVVAQAGWYWLHHYHRRGGMRVAIQLTEENSNHGNSHEKHRLPYTWLCRNSSCKYRGKESIDFPLPPFASQEYYLREYEIQS